jgi:V8-like Glu-specific endopeptidase
VVEAGAITSIDRATAMVMSTLNTLPSDSGAPVFDIDGHQIGIHHGAVVGKGVNVFLLLYPTSAVPWFCQSEPGFQ